MVFYFTGTGNSLYAARALDPETVSIPQAIRDPQPVYEAETVGIVAPIYGHEMPEMVRAFLRRAELRTKYLYVVLTYGNRHANAVELAEAALAEAGRKADYIRTLLMVDNFLPAFDMDEQRALDKHVEEQLAAIRADIGARRRWIEPVTAEDRQAHQNYLRGVGGSPAAAWASFRLTDECIGCGICTNVCPAGCIRLADGRAVRTGENCQACFACIHACPEKAIRMQPVFGYREKNPDARYRNEHVSLSDLVRSNRQPERDPAYMESESKELYGS